jgi:putative addiction module component (TIGR02574 family)
MERADILKAALTLPGEERERLADELWASLDGAGREGVEKAWAVEIERRMDDADAGVARPVPWSEVKAEALDTIRRVRGR